MRQLSIIKKYLSVPVFVFGFLALSNMATGVENKLESKPNWVILQYHHVSDTTPPITSVTPKEFRQHLSLLNKLGFKVVPISTLVKLIQEQKPITEKLAVITFDDGYDNIFENAHPILTEFGFPYSVFISPKPHQVGRQSFLNLEQMKTMHQEGVEFGNHAYDHEYLLRKEPDETSEQWKTRIKTNLADTEAWITKHFGSSIKIHAYPYGEFTPDVQSILSELGVAGLGQQSGPVSPSMDITILPRFPASGRYANPETLATKLKTLAPEGWEYMPENPVTEINPPVATVTVPSPLLKYHRLNCYSPNGLTLLETRNVDTSTTSFEISSETPLPLGRNRYNCTLKHRESGQYYWLSIPWIITDRDGNWAHE